MKKKLVAGLSVGLVAVSVSGTVAAAMVAFDPDNYASGTDISSIRPDLSFSAIYQSKSYNVYALSSNYASTGARVFGHNISVPDNDGDFAKWGDVIFRVDFNNLTNHVSIDVIPDDSEDLTTLTAFDSTGHVLGSYRTSGVSGEFNPERVVFNFTGFDIAYITIYDPIDFNTVKLDNLQYYSPVPVPAVVWLLGSGLVGLAGIRLTRKAA